MGNSAKRDERKANIAELQRRALELRKSGKSYEEISDEMQLTDKTAAYRYVKAAIAAITKEPAEEVRNLELHRLDALLSAVWPEAMKADPQAVASAMRLMERRAKYQGLDAADKHEFTLPDPKSLTPAQLQAAIQSALEARARLAN